MNIIYAYGRNWPSEKAGISFSTYTCYGLAKDDPKHQVDMLMAKNTERDCNKVLRDYFSIESLPNFKVHLIENETRFSETTKFYIKAFNKIRNLAKEKEIDAIITRTVNFLPYLYLIKKLYGIKVLYEAHSFYLDPEFKDEYDRKKEFIYQKFILPRIDGIICHQSILKDLYQQYIPDQNYKVITYGMKEIAKDNNPRENEYIGYIGSLYDYKGVEDLFYALKEVEDKSLKLLIVGGRSHRLDKYYKLARKLGIENRVKITGWVERQEVEKYLKEIKIGMIPLKDVFHSRYLTCPTKIFNYFSHGIPIIGSDLPPIREIVTEQGGLFYESGNVKELVTAINHLNSSSELFNQCSEYILNRAEDLLFEKRGERIIDFIKECDRGERL